MSVGKYLHKNSGMATKGTLTLDLSFGLTLRIIQLHTCACLIQVIGGNLFLVGLIGSI